MESYKVLRRAFKTVGCKNVAAGLKLSPSLIHQWSRARDGQSDAANPLDRVAQLVALTGNEALLDWLCAQRGGRFVRRSEMPSLLQRWVAQITAELRGLLKAENPSPGHRPPAPLSGARETPEGFRCRFRRAGGRCGFPHAARN